MFPSLKKRPSTANTANTSHNSILNRSKPPLSYSFKTDVSSNDASINQNSQNDFLQSGRSQNVNFVNSYSTVASTSSVQSSFIQTSSYQYLSEIEATILRSVVPVNINETDEITVLGQRGIWANKAEVLRWKGPIPIEQYEVNKDPDPEIIIKSTNQNLTYIQELAIRYLKPPTPPMPGDIIIKHEPYIQPPPAPPIIIRQQPSRSATPEPLVIREAPPPPPKQVNKKIITISGKRLPPPPRKVVIERLAPLPSKPQSVIIERWLPYNPVKRRVIYQRPDKDFLIEKPRNVIIQWEAPKVTVKKDFKYLGIIRANPEEYVKRYGPTLRSSKELPEFVLEIKPPQGITLAADYEYNSEYELEGDLEALRYVDLLKEGLLEYKPQLEKIGILNQNISMSHLNKFDKNKIINELFRQVNLNSDGRISIEEAGKLMLKLNSRLGRCYGENDVNRFIRSLNINNDGSVNFQEFKIAFEKIF